MSVSLDAVEYIRAVTATMAAPVVAVPDAATAAGMRVDLETVGVEAPVVTSPIVAPGTAVVIDRAELWPWARTS